MLNDDKLEVVEVISSSVGRIAREDGEALQGNALGRISSRNLEQVSNPLLGILERGVGHGLICWSGERGGRAKDVNGESEEVVVVVPLDNGMLPTGNFKINGQFGAYL